MRLYLTFDRFAEACNPWCESLIADCSVKLVLDLKSNLQGETLSLVSYFRPCAPRDPRGDLSPPTLCALCDLCVKSLIAECCDGIEFD